MIATKKIGICLVLIALIIVLVGSVFAITGSLGNARMVLRAKTGETIEKNILIKNVNNETVNIAMIPGGDLKDDITIKEANFTLQPGEQKQAPISIKVRKVGTTESKIIILFTPLSGKNGIGLSSTIIVVAENGTGFPDEPATDNNTNITNNTDNKVNGTTYTNTIAKLTSKLPTLNFNGMNFIVIGLLSTTVVVIILLIVLYVYARRKMKKNGRKNGRLSKPKKNRNK